MNNDTESALERLENMILEGLPFEQSERWPLNLMSVVTPESKPRLKLPEPSSWKLLHWTLKNELRVEGEGKFYDDIRASILRCSEVLVPLTEGKNLTKEQIADAREAAYFATNVAGTASTYSAAASYHGIVTLYSGAAKAATAAADAITYVVDTIERIAFYERAAAKLVELIEEANREQR